MTGRLEPVDAAALVAALPARRVPAPGWAALAGLRDAARRKVVVLDDDPTGTQTVHGVTVLTRWDAEALADALQRPEPALFLLTNARSLSADAAAALNRRIADDLKRAGRRTGLDVVVISRSDSTLRGHYPLETDVLAEALGPFDATVLAPCFFDGGRVTVGNVHYVAEGDRYLPAAATPFATDHTFGYRSSDLVSWVGEKTAGRVGPDRVACLSLELLRGADDAALDAAVAAAPGGGVIVVNAFEPADLHRAAAALMRAEARGRRYLYRTAASMVSARAAIERRPLLAADDLRRDAGRGRLIVAGSYVPKTTAQLAVLARLPGLIAVELSADRVVSGDAAAEITRAAGRVNAALADDRTVALFTQRALVQVAGRDDLSTGARVTAAVDAVVRALAEAPRWLLAKGGITSSSVATEALGIGRARVLGQLLPGVAVWRAADDARFPGLPYVVFPGNVGDEQALRRAVEALP